MWVWWRKPGAEEERKHAQIQLARVERQKIAFTQRFPGKNLLYASGSGRRKRPTESGRTQDEIHIFFLKFPCQVTMKITEHILERNNFCMCLCLFAMVQRHHSPLLKSGSQKPRKRKTPESTLRGAPKGFWEERWWMCKKELGNRSLPPGRKSIGI